MTFFGVTTVQQYDRGVVFRFGKYRNIREPGLRWIVPGIDRMNKVSLRTITMPIQPQRIITRDSVSIGLAAVAYFRRVDPLRSIVKVENVSAAIYEIAQTTIRNVIGQSTLDVVLSQTESLNTLIKDLLDKTTETWGVLVEIVELKDIELPQSMERAMAKEAEAEREKRAKIIAAEGEALSVGKLAEAADAIAKSPIALQLRNLQVLAEISIDKNSTIIFPAQFMDSIRAIQRFVDSESATSPPPLSPVETT